MKQNFSSVKQMRFTLSVVLILVGLVVLGSQNAIGGERLAMSGSDFFVDAQAGVMWQFDRSSRFRDSGDAEKVLSELNSGEFSNWRFPTREELFELFQVFDLKDNGEVKTRVEGNYWIMEGGKLKVGSWEIGDGCGPTRSFYLKNAGGYVRAVRSMQ